MIIANHSLNIIHEIFSTLLKKKYFNDQKKILIFLFMFIIINIFRINDPLSNLGKSHVESH